MIESVATTDKDVVDRDWSTPQVRQQYEVWAKRQHQLGDTASASLVYRRLLEHEPARADIRYLLDRIERALRATPRLPPDLVWQADPVHLFDVDTVLHALSALAPVEHVDGDFRKISPGAVVVFIKPDQLFLEYCRRAFCNGIPFALYHLGDEGYRDCLDCYRYASAILRPYGSFLLGEDSRVLSLPLGSRTGFAPAAAKRPAAERRFLWSFAGDANKSNRAHMLEALKPFGPAHIHLTVGFNTPDALPIHQYRALLEDSAFVPCPIGWLNQETYRLYEALEAGAIPITETHGTFSYHTRLLGPHPFPMIQSWAEAPALLHRLQSDQPALEALRTECTNFWQALRRRLPGQVADHLNRCFGAGNLVG